MNTIDNAKSSEVGDPDKIGDQIPPAGSSTASNNPACPDGGLIITELAEMDSEWILDERQLAYIFKSCRRTIRNMVVRGELPAPFRLKGRPAWFVRDVVAHVRHRAESALKNAERESRRIDDLRHGVR